MIQHYGFELGKAISQVSYLHNNKHKKHKSTATYLGSLYFIVKFICQSCIEILNLKDSKERKSNLVTHDAISIQWKLHTKQRSKKQQRGDGSYVDFLIHSIIDKWIYTRVGWKVQRLTMMQWLNLTKCGLFFTIVSPAVHTLLSVLQRLDSCGIKALILIIEKVLNCRYDLIISLILLPSQVFFSCWGTENSQMVPNQENMEGDQPVQSHSHAQQPLQQQTCVQENYPGETGLIFQTVWLDYLSQLSQQVGILFSIDSKAFSRVVNEHMPFASPKTEVITFTADDTTLAFFRVGEEGVFITWIVVWSLVRSGGHNTHLGWGNYVQENWLDLLHKVVSSPPTWYQPGAYCI